jgi:hypothetical protein
MSFTLELKILLRFYKKKEKVAANLEYLGIEKEGLRGG